jgi:hypothetical protein
MKIELTKEQQQILINLLDNVSIKGSDAEVVIALKKALSSPLLEVEITPDDHSI